LTNAERSMNARRRQAPLAAEGFDTAHCAALESIAHDDP
jgi:hypothetical protein